MSDRSAESNCAERRDCARRPGDALPHLPHPHRAADARGRADDAGRGRRTRTSADSAPEPSSRLRRPAGAASLTPPTTVRSASAQGARRAATLAAAGGRSPWCALPGRAPGAVSAALTALLALGLALAAPAHAQTSIKLVGNTGQTVAATTSDSTKDRAQAFDTGDNAAGYKLTSVKVDMTNGSLNTNFNTQTVQLFLADNTSGHPTGSSLGTFTNPSGVTAGLRTFTAPSGGIDLDANEGYVFVMDTNQQCGSCASVKRTVSDAEDMGAASGWSIANNGFQRNANNAGGWSNTGDQSLRIELHGYAKQSLATAYRTNLSLHQGDTACAQCPAVPLGLAVPGPGPGEITVNWTPGADTRATPVAVEKWTVYWGNTKFLSLSSVPFTGNALSTRSHTITGLTPGQEYGVAVEARNTTNDEGLRVSGIVRAGLAEPPDAPGAPTVAAGAAATAAGNLSVSWTAPEDNGSAITDYDLRYFEGSADPADAADWVVGLDHTGLPGIGTGTSATITGLEAGTAYRVQVRAANAGGEGPWSDSGSATTAASTKSGNNAPKAEEATTCAQIDMPDVLTDVGSVTAGTFINTSLARGTRACASHGLRGLIDPDGDSFTVAITGVTTTVGDDDTPTDKVFFSVDPRVSLGASETPGIIFRAGALYGGSAAKLTVSLRVTDVHGASATTSITGTILRYFGTSAPSFAGSPVGVLRFVKDRAGAAVLPPAEGGDTYNGEFPYAYAVSGLPAGLTFDAATRTVSGTPTAAGVHTVTYTADDADTDYSQKDSPAAADTADAATQTFTIRVAASETAAAPTIDLVRFVSRPTHDSGNDNVFNTYIRGDEILVDVEYSEPVEVTGDYDNVRVRLDLGSDDATLGNSRKVMKLKDLLNGGRTLRFAYAVAASDTDADGLWVQTNVSNQLMFLANNATVTSAETGVDASRMKTGLSTSGDAGHKVDGSRTTVDGPVPSKDTPATIDGRTLTVTFDKALSTSVDTTELLFHLNVHGAGDVSGGNRNADQHPERVSISGTKLTLTLGEFTGASASDVVTLSYTGGANLLRTATGNHAAPGFRDLAVTNVTGGAVGPLPQRASVAGKSVKIVFDRDLDEGSRPAGSAFTVTADDNNLNPRVIVGTGTAFVEGNTVTVGLTSAVRADEVASVTYVKPASGMLRDGLYSIEAKAFSGFRVETTDDVTGPELENLVKFVKTTNPARSTIYLYYDESLDTASVPAAGDFTVTIGGTAQTVSAVAVASDFVELTIDTISLPPATLSYTPGTNPIRDLAGNDAAKISGKSAFQSDTSAKPVLLTQGEGKPTVDGARLELTFGNGLLDPHSVPDTSAFSLHYPLASGQTDRLAYPNSIDAVKVRGSALILYLVHPVHPCDGQTPFTVSYTKPTASGAATLQSTGTNVKADSISHQDVANARHGQCGKNWVAGMLQGSVVIKAKRPFATDVQPKPEWFTVTASGGPVTVTGAAFDPSDPKLLKLELSREFAAGETVTASYRRPRGEHGLWDTAGHQLGDVTDWPVRATAPAGLTAAFHGLPEVHDGRRLFGFEIRFSEEFQGLRLTALKRALQVTGGRLVDVKRTVRGENRSVTVRVRPSQSGTLTLALAATTDCSAADAVCASDGRKLSAVSASVPGPDTPAPAVLPVLSVADARADEGGTLAFAVALSEAAAGPVTVDYATADGTASAGADYTAASGTLTFAAGETSKTVAVAALADTEAEGDETFTLTLSNASGATLGSAAATGTVADVAPLTATFHGLPAEHDGKKLFGFEVRFSEEFQGLRLGAFKAGALQVTHGRVVDAKRTVRGENRRVTVRVRPTSHEALTLTLAAPEDCAAPSAICTSEGRKLAAPVSATVQGPAVLTVADARAQEGEDAAVEFAVRLSRAASGAVTVDYLTRDGTARAGEDYTATRGTLAFAQGETEKTVAVPLLDDALDEGEETFTLRLSNARGAWVGDGEATGTIVNSDPLQRMWLTRFGRTVADHVTGAVSERLSAPLAGARVTVGGQGVDLAREKDEAWLGRTLVSLARALGAAEESALEDDGGGPGVGEPSAGLGGGWSGPGVGGGASPALGSTPAQSVSGRALLLGSAFHLAREGEGGAPGVAAWGHVRVGGFDGEAPGDGGAVRIDGEVTTGILGADAEWARLLAGVAVSLSEGEGTFVQSDADSGTVESTLTTVSPYARVMLTERVSAWGLVGIGTGDMTVTQDARPATAMRPERARTVTRTDLAMRMGAVGGRGALLEAGETGGVDLALKADAFYVETESEAAPNTVATTVDASRLRLLVEGSRAFRTDSGGVWTPGLELGLRHDGGDAETGTGVELGGRIAYAHAGSGLSVEANIRTLVAHEDSDYREWGASGAVRLAPDATGRGLSFHLAPTLGAASSGAERLWSARDARGLVPGGEFEPESRLAGEVGYGVALFGGRFTGTPNAGFGLSQGGRDWRLGWRLTPAGPGAGGVEVSLDATRREPAGASGAGTGAKPEHGVMLRGAMRW